MGYRKENKLGEDRVGAAARDDAFCFCVFGCISNI